MGQLPCPEVCLPDRDDTCICRRAAPHLISTTADITPSSSTCNTASCSGAEGTSLRNTTVREVAAGTGTRHVAHVQSEMDFRCSALDCDDRLTHSQGWGANAPRSQAEVERHLLWKVHQNIQRNSWPNVPRKLLACIRFLYKVVHKISRLWKFNCAREIE